jgi:hypothetical protein
MDSWIIDIIIPVIIGPLFIVLKCIWDRYDQNKRLQKELLKTNKLKSIENQLDKFYWPVYIRLLKDFEIWSKIIYVYDNQSNMFHNINHDDSDSDIDDTIDELYNKYNRCSALLENGFRCKNIGSLNTTRQKKTYCIHHYYQCMEESKNVGIKQIHIENSDIQIDFKHDGTTMDDEFCILLKSELVENHNKTVEIILDNISVAQPNSRLGKQLMKYIRFVTIYHNLMKGKQYHKKPSDYGIGYPKLLLPMIEKAVFRLQKEYNHNIQHFYR